MAVEVGTLQAQFPQRVLAFVDILGFGQRVEDIKTYDDLGELLRVHERIKAPVSYISSFYRYHERIRSGMGPDDLLADRPDYDLDIAERMGFALGIPVDLRSKDAAALYAFLISDAVVIHGPLSDEVVRMLIAMLLKLARDLMLDGILLRGGIAIGNLMYAPDLVLGSALVRAYRMESKLAKTPRILIPEEFSDLICHTRDRPIRRDEEGNFFLDVFFRDYLAEGPKLDWYPSYKPFHANARESIMRLMREANRPDVIKKVAWLAMQFNDAVERNPDLGVSPIPLG